MDNEASAPTWRTRLGNRIKRRMKRRVLILCVYLVALHLPPVMDWRRDMSGQVGPTIDQLAIDLRKLTVIARAERERREGAERTPAAATTPPAPGKTACAAPQAQMRGQGGLIVFKRVGDC